MVNHTLEKAKQEFWNMLAVIGVCRRESGMWTPLPLGRHIACEVERMFHTGKWTPDQVWAVMHVVTSIHRQTVENLSTTPLPVDGKTKSSV